MSQASRVAKNDTAVLSGTTFGSLDLRKSNFIITTTGAATATLPNGSYTGQQVYILLLADGGDLVISGDYETGTGATLADAKDSITLKWVGGLGWCTVSNQGTVVFA